MWPLRVAIGRTPGMMAGAVWGGAVDRSGVAARRGGGLPSAGDCWAALGLVGLGTASSGDAPVGRGIGRPPFLCASASVASARIASARAPSGS